MTNASDAAARARALVREVLAAAGEPDPWGVSGDLGQPPAPPSEARRRARRIVDEVVAAADAAARSEEAEAPVVPDAPPRDDGEGSGGEASVEDDSGPPPPPQRPRPRELTEAQVLARRLVAEALADEADRRAAEEQRRRDEERREAEERRREEEERRAAEDRRREEERREAEERRQEEERREAEAQRREEERREEERRAEADVAATRPSAQVDLLPDEPPSEGDDPTITLTDRSIAEPIEPSDPTEPTAPLDGPTDELPVHASVAQSGPVERWRQRRRLKRLQAEWAPDAAPPPRRTGRWLIATILLVAAIVLLFPLAVDALRDLVAL